MTAANRRPTVFLHIGLAKSGTSYVQAGLKAHQAELANDGVLVPGGSRWGRQVAAVRDLLGLRRPSGRRADSISSWAWLVAEVAAWPGQTAMVSMEFLSLANAEQVDRTVTSLAPSEVEVVVTARDLARVVPAMWQESLQNGHSWHWEEYVRAVSAGPDSPDGAGPAFWHQHDLPRILSTWADRVGLEHVHLVTVPPPGAPVDLLWSRFCSVTGLPSHRYPPPDQVANASLGAAGTELMRQVSAASEGRLEPPIYLGEVKHFVAKQVLATLADSSFGLPAAEHDWVRNRAQWMVEGVRRLGVSVAGELADLMPVIECGSRSPDDVGEAEVLAAAVEVIVRLAERSGAARRAAIDG